MLFYHKDILSHLKYIPDYIKELSNEHWHLFKKGYKKQNIEYYPHPDDFNIEWNERFGNDLSTLSLLSMLAKHPEFQNNVSNPIKKIKPRIIDNYISKLIKKLCSYPSWHVKGHDDDYINIMHLVCGVIYGMEALDIHRQNRIKDTIITKLTTLLKHSLNSHKSTWYSHTATIHNHCFHNLLMRYIIVQYLISQVPPLTKQIQNINLEKCLTHTIIGFEKNLEILEQIGDGSTYEGAAYQSYSTFSLMQFLYMDYLDTQEKKYKNNVWLKEYHNYIYYTYIENGHYAYNIADSPYNWRYGPEYQLFFIDWYCELNGKASAVAQLILDNRIKHKKNQTKLNSYDTLRYCCLNLWLPASMGINIHNSLPKKEQVTFVDNELFCEKIPHKKYLYLKYGIYGGKTVSKMKSKNIGHVYPNIGDVAFYTSSPLLTNPLYSKPKFTSDTNTWTFIMDKKAIGQIGIVEINKDDSSKKPINFILNHDFPYSKGISYPHPNGHTIYIIAVTNYDIPNMTIHRIVISLNVYSILIIDVLNNNNEKNIIVKNHFNNHTNTFKWTDHTQKIAIGNIGIITTTEHYQDIKIENKKRMAHKLDYNLSSLTVTRKMIQDINIFSHMIYDNSMGNLSYELQSNNEKVCITIFKEKNKMDTFEFSYDWILKT